MNPIVKKVLNIALDVLIAILVIFAVLISMVAISSNANNNVPSVFGYSPFSVQTGSMEPNISKGDYILVEPCDAANLAEGDVISFFAIEQNKKIVKTHRIIDVVKVDGSVLYQTKGDANAVPDDVLVSSGDVVGKFNGKVIPFMGTVMNVLSSKWGFFFIILVPILLFTVYQVYRLIATVLYNKKVEMASFAADRASDDVKEAIIAEYLAKQETDNQSKQDEISE